MCSSQQEVRTEHATESELLDEVKRLKAHVTQLKCLLAKKNGSTTEAPKKEKPFKFSKWRFRHVALKFLYLGWDYNGYVVQEETNQTIEAKLFDALNRAHLIRSRETSNYHRCGRTDKGVSAFEQVVTIDLRTKAKSGVGVFKPEDFADDADAKNASSESEDVDEIPYVRVLNRLLPREIRVIAWAPIEVGVSARFDCTRRVYRYFFPRGTLCIESMRRAAVYLVGEHDFRNLCKMDVGNGVTKFVRNVFSAKISSVKSEEETLSSDSRVMYELVIESNAFLWHQIRCIVAILMLVGMKREEPEIVTKLLDVTNQPCKPQYTLASELPLCLFETHYDNIEWIYDAEELVFVRSELERFWMEHRIKSSMIECMIENVKNKEISICGEEKVATQDYGAFILGDKQKSSSYKSLLSRPTCDSLESRIEHYAKRRKQN